MSIRLRLALWYGALCALVLLVTGLVSYAFHDRGHYDDLDRALITSAGHAAVETSMSGNTVHLVRGNGGLEIALRLYGPDGSLVESLPADQTLPPINPTAILAAPASPAYDVVAGLAPSVGGPAPDPGEGAFGTLLSGGQRWRAYVLPLRRGGDTIGYVEALTSLGRLDASMQAFRLTLLALAVASLAAVFVGSWATASGALRPISHMVETAQSIAHSRDFAKRVGGSTQRDELNNLAHAFNEMLVSLEEVYRAQQRFVADASHEMRAPLTAIQANLELLERRPDMPPSERDEAISEASREAHRLTRLVADLLALARADAGVSLPRQQVELDRVVLEALADARHLARGQRIEVEKLEPAIVAGDPDRLKQLLLILLDNAINYTPPDGTVTLGLRRNGNLTEITVRDTGIGIPAEALPHVFERFYRADPARARDPGGTGLGLSIARWIVEQHGGHIALTSTPGQGTTVSVSLPVLR